jgi:hypothetical protein
VQLFEILQDGFHTPLSATQIADLFHAGRLGRNTPCKALSKKEWRTIDELFPLLKYETSSQFRDSTSHAEIAFSIKHSALVIVKHLLGRLVDGHAPGPADDTQRPSNTPRKVIHPRASQLRPPAIPTSLPPSTRNVCTLDSLSWDNFELLIGETFRRKGYGVEISSGLGADGGKDLSLRKDGELTLVQCKKLARGNRVTATQMRDFFGLIVAEEAAKGFFVTTGYFSADAKKFAIGKPIELLERFDVEALVAETSGPGENLYDITSWLDAFASRINIVNPLCPFCDSPMTLRRGAFGRPFWGCTRYRTHFCKGKRDPRDGLLQAGLLQV